MQLTLLELQNFRNYPSLSLSLRDGVSLFYGRNAQGKTNILEAVYLAGTTRSHKGSKDREMIRIGEEEAHIRMEFVHRNIPHRIDMHLRRNGKKGIAIDRLPVRRAGEILQIASMVFFSPEDLMLVKAGPSARRKFMNIELCAMDPVYLSTLAAYNRCLLQRNTLLREMGGQRSRESELDIWDSQLLKLGTVLIGRRARFAKEIGVLANAQHKDLTGGEEDLDVRYEPNAEAEAFPEMILESRDRDIRFRETHTGPHRDDLMIRIGDMDARSYGSQGQQRTCALSLKLAEIDLIQKETGDRPLLLLDDVLSELDDIRQEKLLSKIRPLQTLITCTGIGELSGKKWNADAVFRVEGGELTETTL